MAPVHLTLAEGQVLGWDVCNASWPPGRLTVQYQQTTDRYHLVTEYGQTVAIVGPTLLAYAIADLHNTLWAQTPAAGEGERDRFVDSLTQLSVE